MEEQGPINENRLQAQAQEAEEVSLVANLLNSWPALALTERRTIFGELPRPQAEELFLNLSADDQSDIFTEIDPQARRSWIRLLAPDDAADLIQALPEENRQESLNLLDSATRTEVSALLAYAEDEAGGLMNSRFARLRPDMSADEAIRYLRVQTRSKVETVYYAYVLDPTQKLLGVVSLRQLVMARPEKKVHEIMNSDMVTVPENMDQEELGRVFYQNNFVALPVIDQEGRMKGIVTVDDIVDVVQEEATEDIQKLGGTEALEAPYLQIELPQMIKKRGIWLTVLFLGEMLTATAMGYYEQELERAIVLAMFIPLIISSGGNSGSQASTLIIRAMALGEVRPQDWWRVFWRELASGMALGLILGVIGLLRVSLWPQKETIFGEHYFLVALTVSFSLVGVVLWGTLMGSMLPFLLRFFRVDPATASTPFVATLVDVTGLIIYFSFAHFFLSGTLL